MRRLILLASVMILMLGPSVLPQGMNQFKAVLTGYKEVPSISTTAQGDFRLLIGFDEQTISYTLSYSGLEGTDTLFAHIHFGQTDVNGGISAFLCGGGDKPPCPDGAGTVTGVIDAADVIGPAGQGIAAGEIDEFIAAIRAGVTYANVHTNTFPGGEIRGQIESGRKVKGTN